MTFESTAGASTITSRNREFLDRRLADALTGHLRNPAPRYGPGGRVLRTDRVHVADLARRVSILRALHRSGGRELLDVGGGFGQLAALARDVIGREVILHDLSPAFLLLAKIWMGVRSVCGDAAALPFRKGAFGTVVCSEVVEHVERPVPVFLELSRVARETVLVSTDQCCPSRWEYAVRMATADRRSFHSDRNCYLPEHFATLMGPATMLSASLALPRRIHGRKIGEVRDLADLVGELSSEQPYSPAAGGILAVCGLHDASVPSDQVLVDRVIDQDREADARFLDAARKTLGIMGGGEVSPDGSLPVDLLCCPGPSCRGSLLREAAFNLTCGECGGRYGFRWGIPVLDPAGYCAIEDMLEGVGAERAEDIRVLARTLERGGRVQWAEPLSWAILGVLGFLRMRVGIGERARILYGWAREALAGTQDPGAEK